MISEPSYTQHAQLRMAQRNLSLDDISFVITYGTPSRRAGALHIVLRDKDIPRSESRTFARLEGTVVLLDDTETVVETAYRGDRRRVCKDIRCKTKWDLKKERARCRRRAPTCRMVMGEV